MSSDKRADIQKNDVKKKKWGILAPGKKYEIHKFIHSLTIYWKKFKVARKQ